MICVEFRSQYPADQPVQYLGHITVHADGTYDLQGLQTPEGFPPLLDLEQPMVAPGRGLVHFGQDPVGWARLLPRNFHGLSWQAHITEDTEVPTL